MRNKYMDAADHHEDTRITMIGEKAMGGGRIAFVTDSDPGKADRYILKLLTRYPQLKVVDRFDGPTKDMISVIVELHKEPLA